REAASHDRRPTRARRSSIPRSVFRFTRGFTRAAARSMTSALPVVHLARHGETAWSLSGQHTGLTDLPLTERGVDGAMRLGQRLAGSTFAKVYTSPLQRAA